MSINKPSAYGVDIACVRDADPLFTSATGLALVQQDAFHRVTSDSVLGPGGDGWGRDARRLLGQTARQLALEQAIFAEVLQYDQRILSADVKITAIVTKGLADVRFAATCITDEGPFDLIFNVSQLTSAKIEEQAQ